MLTASDCPGKMFCANQKYTHALFTLISLMSQYHSCYLRLDTYVLVFSFIRLADYLIVNTMHVLAVNSVSTLLNYLKEQLANTPSLEEIQAWNKEPERPPTPEEKEVGANSKLMLPKQHIALALI